MKLHFLLVSLSNSLSEKQLEEILLLISKQRLFCGHFCLPVTVLASSPVSLYFEQLINRVFQFVTESALSQRRCRLLWQCRSITNHQNQRRAVPSGLRCRLERRPPPLEADCCIPPSQIGLRLPSLSMHPGHIAMTLSMLLLTAPKSVNRLLVN